jgi:hypothetical protein
MAPEAKESIRVATAWLLPGHLNFKGVDHVLSVFGESSV